MSWYTGSMPSLLINQQFVGMLQAKAIVVRGNDDREWPSAVKWSALDDDPWSGRQSMTVYASMDLCVTQKLYKKQRKTFVCKYYGQCKLP